MPTQKQIKLAKEFDFEVKKEKMSDELWYTNEVVNIQPTDCNDCFRKQTLIETLSDENKQLKTEVQCLKESSDNKSQKIFELEQQLQHSKNAHKMEIDELNLKMEQFTSQRINASINDSSNDDDQFEVERLLKHKTQNGKQMFFVKWKGFNNRHNSWVQRSSLNCKKILQQYLKCHDLK